MLQGLQHLDTGVVKLCLRDTGQGPAVLFLHGTTASLGVWDPVVRLLGDEVRAVAVDQRGHGRSDKPARGYSAEEYSQDVAQLIRALDCGPALLVGHSLGARNAVVLAARHPELVSGVVAVDYTPFVEKEVLDSLEQRVMGGDQLFATESDIVEYLRGRYPRLPEDALVRRARYGYVAEGRGYRPLADPAAMTATVAGLRQDFEDEMHAVRVPVTLVRGEHSRIVSDQAFDRTQRLRPDVPVLEVGGVDHYVPEEAPEAVGTAVQAMLAQLPVTLDAAANEAQRMPTSQ